MKLLKGFALRGKIAVAAFVLAIGAGICGALLPKTHAAFAESETQATLPASTEQLEQTPRADGEESETPGEATEPIEVEVPKLVGDASVPYDGKPHRFGITGYLSAAKYMSFKIGGAPAKDYVLGDTITFEASERDKYIVTFELGDGYVFAAGENVSDDRKSATVEFSIESANDQTVTLDKEYCFVYGEEIKVVPTVKYTEGNEITISYYTYSGNANSPQGEKAVPVHAGVYYVVASVAGTNNYNSAEAGAVLVIEKKELKVAATVHAFYGQKVSQDDIFYTITGFAYEDTEEDCVSVNFAIWAQGMTYGDGTGHADVGRHTPKFATVETTVNAYKSTTASSIYGFSKKRTAPADNYYFTPTDNCLVHVRPLPVSVVVGNASGSFGSVPQYNSGITLRWANSADNKKIPEADRDKQDGELMKLLNITSSSFYCTATSKSDVDKYPIQIVNWKNENYEVTFVDGIYEIVPASLVVEWSEGGGNYGNVAAPQITSMHALIGVALLDLKDTSIEQPIREGLSFRFVDLTGSQSFEADEVPVNAGNYSVELTFASEGRIGKNYVLSSKSAAARRFGIGKLTLDVEKLHIENEEKLEYNNGNVVVPILSESGFEEYVDVQIDKATVVGTYHVTFTIKDFANVQWSIGKTAEYKLPFNVAKAKNMLVGSIYIEGWTYGDAAKVPSVTLSMTKDVSEGVDIVPVFEYSSDNGVNWTSVVPTAAGNYLVRATTKGTTNVDAFASLSATPFNIARKAIAKPQLDLSTANNVYTGEDLHANVSGFDQTLMTFTYVGNFTVVGNEIALTVRNAGAYTLTIELFDSNYVWADGDVEKVYRQVWTVAPKRIEKPTAGENVFPTMDKIITYLPDGFDENTMIIAGNEAGYDGTFTAEVFLKDSVNYVWDDGTPDTIQFEWKIGGVNTAFAALISVMVVLAALGIGAGVLQYLLYKRKQRREAEAANEEDEKPTETQEKREGGEQA